MREQMPAMRTTAELLALTALVTPGLARDTNTRLPMETGLERLVQDLDQ